MSTDEIPDALGRDGALHMHLSGEKFAANYLVGSKTLVFDSNTKRDFTENKTTCPNTDTRLGPNLFLRGISTDELRPMSRRGGALKGCLEYMEIAPDGHATDNIQELKGVMSRHPIDHKRGPVGAEFRNCYPTVIN